MLASSTKTDPESNDTDSNRTTTHQSPPALQPHTGERDMLAKVDNTTTDLNFDNAGNNNSSTHEPPPPPPKRGESRRTNATTPPKERTSSGADSINSNLSADETSSETPEPAAAAAARAAAVDTEQEPSPAPAAAVVNTEPEPSPAAAAARAEAVNTEPEPSPEPAAAAAVVNTEPEPSDMSTGDAKTTKILSPKDFSKPRGLFDRTPWYSAADILKSAIAFASDPDSYDGSAGHDFKNLELSDTQLSIRKDMPAKALFLIILFAHLNNTAETATNSINTKDETAALDKIKNDRRTLAVLIMLKKISRGCGAPIECENILNYKASDHNHQEGSTAWFLGKACEAYQILNNKIHPPVGTIPMGDL